MLNHLLGYLAAVVHGRLFLKPVSIRYFLGKLTEGLYRGLNDLSTLGVAGCGAGVWSGLTGCDGVACGGADQGMAGPAGFWPE